MEIIILATLSVGALWLGHFAYKVYVAAKEAQKVKEESDRLAEEEKQASIMRENKDAQDFYQQKSRHQYVPRSNLAPNPPVAETSGVDPLLTYFILSQSIQPNSYSSNPYPHASSFLIGGGGTFDGAGASADWPSSSSPSSSCDSSSSYSSDSSSSSSDSSSSCSSSD